MIHLVLPISFVSSVAACIEPTIPLIKRAKNNSFFISFILYIFSYSSTSDPGGLVKFLLNQNSIWVACKDPMIPLIKSVNSINFFISFIPY